MNTLTIYYKFYQNEGIRLYKEAYEMILSSVNIGAYMDKYQFTEVTIAGTYEEISNIEKAYSNPQWEKLCNINSKEPRQEVIQLAFDLNLDYNMTEDKICDKLKRISLMDKNDFMRSAIEKQEDRINSELASSDEYVEGGKIKRRYKCNLKSTVLKNPYAYNDARMAFYKSPKDGEVYCFTSDTFIDLISSKRNPYNDELLPSKFLNTIRSQVNVLNEIGVYKKDTSVKDALKEIFNRSKISNDRTEYAYNTVISGLELNGVSKERFDNLSILTQQDTILRDICGVRFNHFDKLTPNHRVRTVTRVIYMISKNKDNPNPNGIFETIGKIIGGGTLMDDDEFEDEFADLLS